MLCCSFLTACEKNDGKTLPQISLNDVAEVQLTYRQDVYNIEISYVSGVLNVVFVDEASCLCGLSFTVDADDCRVSYGEITHAEALSHLPDTYLPCVLYRFVAEFSGVICAEKYNSRQMCSYVSRTVGDTSVTFEFYNNAGNSSYCLIVL